jgi:hypothetical protein
LEAFPGNRFPSLIREKTLHPDMDKLLQDIAPYSDSKIQEALAFLESNDQFIKGVQIFYPSWTADLIVEKLRSCKTCSDFQVQFIEGIIKNSIKSSMDSVEIIGLDSFDCSNSLYISNHRDIFLDSALLQNHLWDIGKPFTEISLGDNLMVNDTMKAVAKLNNMFTVFRGGSRAEFFRNSMNLSKYLRFAMVEKKVSSWIAQGNGRTKDGNDLTSSGLIKMLLLSGSNDMKKSIDELNIVVSTISFEYEPCAFEKANELSIVEKEGSYVKKKFENINSIVSGIQEYKGNVKLVFEKLNVNNIEFSNIRNKDAVAIAKEIDRIVHSNYQLWKTNYIAYDILYNENRYGKKYSPADRFNFEKYLAKSPNEDIYYRILKMYVNPLHNQSRLV